ncbi:MAG TPA: hypothetical protein VL346_13155 [Acidobacteriaceae bacterium]|jgi:hypothetical protein|nr:hypothetical protein [Acidobacteriaceae bacterium]
MKLSHAAVIALFTLPALAASPKEASLLPGTTIPVTLTKALDAGKVHAGDAVTGKTTQAITLASGQRLPKGALLRGRVVEAARFQFNRAHYAAQQNAGLSIRFDSLASGDAEIPLHVYVRAMAAPTTVAEAHRPSASDMDSLGTTTQVGGDLVTPSQQEILSAQGDIVGYRHDGGNYAHLIAASGNGASCDAGNTEQAMDVFSASACGLYGFPQASMATNADNTISLVSNHYTPKLYAQTAILLEEQPQTQAANDRHQ